MSRLNKRISRCVSVLIKAEKSQRGVIGMVRVAHNRYTHIKNEDIVDMYNDGLSSIQIAERLGTSKSFVLRRLDEVGLDKRKQNTYDDITKDALHDMYIIQKMSVRAIAKRFGCGKTLVNKRLKIYDIPLRKHAGDKAFTPEERKEKWGKRLNEHPRWKGGVTAVSTLIRNRLAPVSRERLYKDNFTCQKCGNPNGSMHVHHIRHFSDIVADILRENPQINLINEQDRIPFVEICEKDDRLLDIDNLTTLCKTCHEVEHSDEYIEPVMWETLEKQWREYVQENHFTMSIKEMRKVVRAENNRIVEYMDSENMKYAYDNPQWLSEQIKTKNFTDISREFSCTTKKINASFIEEKVKEFGLQKEDNSEIVELYNQGKTLTEISKIVGVSRQSIRVRLMSEGIDTKYRAFRKDIKFDDVVSLVNDGHTLHSIAEIKRCSVCKIRDLLKENGTSITELKQASSQ